MHCHCELLSPVGRPSALVGVINAGANAVYLAGKRFGARGYNENFTKEEIASAISFAHLRNVKVYVTINTIIFQEEIEDVIEYCDFLVENHVDAFIVQDLGVARCLCQRYEKISVHASTQMNVYSFETAKILANMGITRIILARETSLDVIKKIREELDIEIEVFAHGALCSAYSGLCMASFFLNNRSGNRGFCVQCCRNHYKLMGTDKEGYLLSTKDLNTIDYLDNFIPYVDSIKIEGRRRSDEYAILATKTYRRALDSKSSKQNDDLKKMFNRDFTKGYINNEKPRNIINSFRPNHLGIVIGKVIKYHKGLATISISKELLLNDGVRIIGKNGDYGAVVHEILVKGKWQKKALPGDIVDIPMEGMISVGDILHKTLDSLLVNSLKVYKEKNFDLLPITYFIKAQVGEPLYLELRYKDIIVTKEGKIVDKANSRPTTKEELEKRIRKTGDTQFYIEDGKTVCDSDCFIVVSDFNNLRREIFGDLFDKVLYRPKTIINPDIVNNSNFKNGRKNSIAAKVTNTMQLEKCLELGFDIIYHPFDMSFKKTDDITYIPYSNVITENAEDAKCLLVSNIGLLKNGYITDKFLNVSNIYTLNTLNGLGASRVTLSPEVELGKIPNLVKEYQDLYHQKPDIELVVYGKPEVMFSKNTLGISSNTKIVDDVNNVFICSIDRTNTITIRLDKPFNYIDEVSSLSSVVNVYRLEFFDEIPSQIEILFRELKNNLK